MTAALRFIAEKIRSLVVVKIPTRLFSKTARNVDVLLAADIPSFPMSLIPSVPVQEAFPVFPTTISRASITSAENHRSFASLSLSKANSGSSAARKGRASVMAQ